jgi:hypothetical protein
LGAEKLDPHLGNDFNRSHRDTGVEFLSRKHFVAVVISALKAIPLAKKIGPLRAKITRGGECDDPGMLPRIASHRHGMTDFGMFSATENADPQTHGCVV